MANQSEPVSYTTDQAAEAFLKMGGPTFGDDEPEEEADAPGPEPEEDDTSDPEEPSDEEISLETLDDVAKALGVDPDQLYANLKMRVKVNGEESLVSLAEAQQGSQMDRDYRQKTMELSEERRALQAEREQSLAQMHRAALDAAAALQWTEQAIYAELNNPYMAQLRQTNPGEWVARQQEIQAKLGNLQNVRQQAHQQFAQALQSQAQQQEMYAQAQLAEEERKLTSKVSDWSDAKKSEIADFLKSQYGFSNQEISGVVDHKLILMALDAQKGAKAAQDVAKVLPKVKAIPNIQAPGKTKSALTVKSQKINGLKGRLSQTGKLQDAARMIEALM